jgi:RNA polymerase sigma-70 factor (ECF subfamily)
VPTKAEDLARGRFKTTHWSIVLACSGDDNAHQAQEALAKLFQIYWYPLYAYTRRRGYGEQDAQDLVQAFCVYLQEKHTLARADPQRGKFRTFLLTSLQNFLANEEARARAQKRGGGREMIFLDAEDAHARYRLEPVDRLTPEAIFETRWAHAVLEETLAGLRADFVERGKERLFDGLASFLSADEPVDSYQQAAMQLGLPLSAIKTTVYRLRQDYRKKLREEIAKTVSATDEIDDELRYLRKVLAGVGTC